MPRTISWAFILFSVVLLVLSLVGDLTSFGDYRSRPPRHWEAFDPALVARTESLDDLYREAEARLGGDLRSAPPAAAIGALFDVVTDAFTHGYGMHTPASNWIAWSLGFIDPAFRSIRDPEQMISRGHSLLCGHSSFVLLTLAERAGIPTRHVGLNGHVVMEAFHDGEWRLYDTDYEVTVEGKGGLLGIDDLQTSPELLASAYALNPEVPQLYLSGNDNTHGEEGDWFIWKSDILAAAEPFYAVLKYLVPLLLLVVSGRALRRAG